MTRVTENMIFQSLAHGIQNAQQRLLDRQRQAQTGLCVERASDDPVAAVRSLALDKGLGQLESMERVSGRAELLLMGSEAALGEAVSVMMRVQEVAIEGANGTLSDAQREALANEVVQLRDALLSLGNTEVGGEYVFAGYQTQTEPFLADGTFVGDSNLRQVEIGPGVTVSMNVSGAEAFTAVGGQEIFTLLDDLAVDLAANDQSAIESRLSGLESAREQLSSVRSGAGVNFAKTREAADMRDAMIEWLRVGRSEVVERDMTQSYVDLLQAQQALQATITQATRILSGMSGGV